MLELALSGAVVTLLAGAFRFTGIPRGAATVGKAAFGIFLLIAIALFVLITAGMQILT